MEHKKDKIREEERMKVVKDLHVLRKLIENAKKKKKKAKS
jgi:hypothetical protein